MHLFQELAVQIVVCSEHDNACAGLLTCPIKTSNNNKRSNCLTHTPRPLSSESEWKKRQMSTEPRNKESYPRSPAHFQLQRRKKQTVVRENSGNTKTLLAVPPVLGYIFSVLTYTTGSNYYSILLWHTGPTRDKERLIFKQLFFAASSQICSSSQIGSITK